MTGIERQRSSWVALAVVAGGGVLWAGAAHAQASGGMPAAGSARKPFTVDVIGAILYDSNLSKGSVAVTDARKLHKSEITYAPALAASTYLPLGRNSVFLNASAGYDFREYNKELESGRVDVTGGGLALLGPCQASLSGAYAIQQSNLADLPIRVTRNRQTTRSVTTQVACATPTGLTGFVGANAADMSNSADFNLVDSDSISITGGFGYGSRQLGTLQVIGGYGKTNYGESSNPLLVLQPGFETYSVGVQYSRAIGNRLTGSASIGYQTVHSDSPLQSDSSNLTGTGELNYSLNSRIGLTLSYSRAAAPSIIEGYDYILDQSVSVGARYTMSSRIQTSFGATWSKNEYKGSAPVLLDVPTDSEMRTLFGGVSLSLGKTASVSLNATQEKRTSKPSIFNYTAYQVGVTAKKSF